MKWTPRRVWLAWAIFLGLLVCTTAVDARQINALNSVTATLPDGGDNNAPRIADADKSEYLPANPEAFQHDADGNLTQDGKWSYIWDAENRLIEMETLPAAVTAGAEQLKLEFAYDSQGRRFSKTVSTWNGSTGNWETEKQTTCIWDAYNLLYELTDLQNGSQTEKAYVWGRDLSGTMQGAGGVGGLLMVTHAGEATYFPGFDGNGNVVEYVDAETGASVAQYAYSAFGETLRATGERADEFTHRFSTKPFDLETGLVAFELRYFDPATGRWLSRDGIGELGGPNLYAFIGNDPLNAIDYLGYYRVGFLEFTDGGGVSGFFGDLGDYVGANYSGVAQGAGNIGKAGIEVAKTPYYASQLAGTTAGYLVYDRGAILDGAVDIYDLGALFIDDPCFRASIRDELGEYLSDADNLSQLSANASVALLTGGMAKAAQAGKLTQYLNTLQRLADRADVGSKKIPDDAFVRFDPTRLDDAIGSGGVQQRFFDQGKVWLTKYGDIKNVTNATDLEQILYRQNLWDGVSGKFSDGATLRLVNGIDDAMPAGVTNKINGVRQWRVTHDIPATDLEIINRILNQ